MLYPLKPLCSRGFKLGGGLNRCARHLFKAINQWKIENGKWKILAPSPDWGRLGWGFFSRKHFVLPPPTLPQVGGGNCFPCQTFSMKVFTDYSPLEGRWQGEGSSRRVKSCNELFNFSTSMRWLKSLHFNLGIANTNMEVGCKNAKH